MNPPAQADASNPYDVIDIPPEFAPTRVHPMRVRARQVDAGANAANFSLPTLAEPLTGQGKFDWKGETVDFNLGLTTVGDLREKRPAKLVLALDMPAIAVRFDGSVVTRPLMFPKRLPERSLNAR